MTGAHAATQISGTAKTTWTFTFTAGAGEGLQKVTANPYRNYNDNNTPVRCIADVNNLLPSADASYVLDNTGPTVTGSLSSAAPTNTAGWYRTDVSITWSATDNAGGSGIASGPTPATDSVTADGTAEKTATAADRVGNSGTGSVTVKLDKTAPTITGSRSPAANGNGWNNSDVTVSFTCADATSGIKSCTSSTTLSGEGANQSVTGTAVDNADNSASTTVGGISIDKSAPSLSGTPSGPTKNTSGWYTGDVTVAWTCSDSLSGIAGDGACPASSVVTGEGSNLSASASVGDKAGNTASATVSGLKIDGTTPSTTATAPSGWNNTSVEVTLSASDSLSGVAGTYYKLDGGAAQTYTSAITISADGVHTLEYWSVDSAGNEEAHHTVQVQIDQTGPTITHSQSPAKKANGWNNSDVTVTFTCSDTGSGIASCTADGTSPASASKTVTTEGEDQAVTGTAVDNAGNTATDRATVSIDKTAPTISAAPDRVANGNGWYNADVTVSFTCGDRLSGVDVCPASQTLGEGANQSASGTATDAAGNSASAGVTGINVDKTAPSLSGSATGPTNGSGWYSGDVTVAWSCSDSRSGITGDGSCPASSVVTGEGVDLSASASVSDKAGNTTNASVGGIKIDRTRPSTAASVSGTQLNGWYTGAVTVTLAGSDNLSGVATTYYRVDGGTAQVYAGSFSHNLAGTHTIAFWSVDTAGNTEDNTATGNTITIKIDNIAPTITYNLSPAANGNGWNNTDVVVSFTCSDSESGIKDCTGSTTLSSSGSVTGTAVDYAGNSTSTTVTVNIDKVAPSLSGAPTTSPNAAGWYNSNVTVAWTCSDNAGGSGIDGACPADSTISSEGTGLTTSASVSDRAGNTTTATSSPAVKIDQTAPSTSASVSGPLSSSGWYTGAVTVTLAGSDNLSGVATTYYRVDGGTAQVYAGSFSHNLAGTHTIAFWSVDTADNGETAKTVEVKIDGGLPTITGSRTPAANANGWNNTDVTVSFTCSDAETSIASCSSPTTLSAAGANQSVTGTAVDAAGNTATATVSGISIDKTAPTVGALSFSVNPKAVSESTQLSATAGDALSGVAGGEYFFGTNDPGVGSGTAMALSGSTLSATIGTSLLPGVYTVNVRSQDRAGNWSTVSTGSYISGVPGWRRGRCAGGGDDRVR